MILYGSSLSPFVRKVIAYAAEKAIALQIEPTGVGPGQQSEAFLATSPLRKMPALADGDYRLADSSAIIHYLEAKFPEPALIPIDPQARGKVVWFDEFGDTVLAACGAKLFFNRVVAPMFLKREGDLEAADRAQHEELPPILDYLEQLVPDPGGYLVGARLTLADIAVASPFANLDHLGCEIDPRRHGRVSDYIRSILSRPSFSPWIEREKAFLAKVAA